MATNILLAAQNALAEVRKKNRKKTAQNKAKNKQFTFFSFFTFPRIKKSSQ